MKWQSGGGRSCNGGLGHVAHLGHLQRWQMGARAASVL